MCDGLETHKYSLLHTAEARRSSEVWDSWRVRGLRLRSGIHRSACKLLNLQIFSKPD